MIETQSYCLWFLIIIRKVMNMSAIFNGDTIPQRRGTNSVKWDTTQKKFGSSELLPMWVADMDFPSPPCVVKALRESADFGVYGYYAPPASYFHAFIDWENRRHAVEVKEEWLRFTPGVVAGLNWCVQIFTLPGDACMILTPCYYPFTNAIADNGRRLITSDLIDQNGHYTINFRDLEEKIIHEDVKMLLLCAPHNPVGRVWTEVEMRRIADICVRHRVYIISDEIHQDITFGRRHFSMLRLPICHDRLVVLTAASKTFNIAGCQNSFAVIPNNDLRSMFDVYVKRLHMIKGVFWGYIAAEAAFREGESWLFEVLSYIEENYRLFKDSLTESLPEIVISPLEGTYMCWIDLGAYVKPRDIQHVVQDAARLAVDYGDWFWPGNRPDTHIRINIATSRENVKTAADQLIKAIVCV